MRATKLGREKRGAAKSSSDWTWVGEELEPYECVFVNTPGLVMELQNDHASAKQDIQDAAHETAFVHEHVEWSFEDSMEHMVLAI